MKKIKVKDFTAKVRETIGTPFHHAGRVVGPNGGMDCGAILLYALQELGIETFDKSHYKRGDGLKDMKEILEKNNYVPIEIILDGLHSREPFDFVHAGDVILLRSGELYHHLVYYTEDNTIIHSWFTGKSGTVVETKMLDSWRINVESVWRLQGLEQ